jgi:succinate dehydrogenase/fumarate reductase-like Fe-S protein
MKTTLAVTRGGAGVAPHVESFEIDFVAGQSVLDGLRIIRCELEPSLAFRYACINANACKECMMQIDGKIDYACTTRLREGTMMIAPLPKKTLVRDLVTEIAPPDERLHGER